MTTLLGGSVYHAFLSGLMVQWLLDPERSPSTEDLASALPAMAGRTDQLL